MSGDIGERDIVFLGCLLIAIFVAICSCLFVYFVWCRRLQRRVLELQVGLFKLSSQIQGGGVFSGNVPNRKRIAMSVEGKSVEIVEVGGKEMVRFEEKLSRAERHRILAYLKSEGFIS